MISSPGSNDAALNEQLNLTRETAIQNLQNQTEESRQAYRDEIDKLESQKQLSEDVINSSRMAARANNSLETELDYKQKLKNAEVALGAWNHRGLNHLSQDTPEKIHANIVRTSQELMNAQEAFLAYHPEQKDNPDFQLHFEEDAEGNFSMQRGPDVAMPEQNVVANLDEARQLSLDELRQIVQRQKTGREQNSEKPLVEFLEHPESGTFDIALQSGEIFRGFAATDNREAIRRIAESRVNTQHHYQQLLESAVEQQQPANDQQQQVEQPQIEQPLEQQAQPEYAIDPAWSAWLAEQALHGVSRQFGYSNSAEFIADQNARYAREQLNNQLLDDYQHKQIVAQFFHENPDYPQSPRADDILEEIVNQNGWEWSPSNMAAAHALAKQRGLYRPLTPEDIAIANGYAPQQQRPTPPPILSSSNPDMARPTEDVNTMPLDQLRKLALTEGRAGMR